MPFPQRVRSLFLRHWSRPSPQHTRTPQRVRVENSMGNVLNPALRRRPRPPGFPPLTLKVRNVYLVLLTDGTRPPSILQMSTSCLLRLPVLTLQTKHGGSLIGVSTNCQSMTLRVIYQNLSNQNKSRSKSLVTFWRIVLLMTLVTQ